jgi:hypothetical protein
MATRAGSAQICASARFCAVIPKACVGLVAREIQEKGERRLRVSAGHFVLTTRAAGELVQ